MNVALSATIQQNSHSMSNERDRFVMNGLHLDPNNLANSAMSNLTSAECRQSEELSNQMMNCLR